ncbi:L30e-like protein [Lophiostoma macrostomum CBS 122681]|uniref:L30e-like protein n=1 Tax=Lophiostoma macrostomum CBS 122681 TaxID=1314788 RepID=A0A6A6SRU9_9PLEO|nr:L30e-like protein [Lophiostoma macrostomum CBS 122681]
MSKDATEKKIKKEKKDKKEKRTEDSGGVVKTKKDKKEKKLKTKSDVADALQAELEKDERVSLVKVDEGGDALRGALVPFAVPLADDAKEVKKVLRTVKKSAKTKTLRRGVKEVVKALRKSTSTAPASSDISDPPFVCIIAADISPMDVISHIPVLCEDHNIPYIYVRSRAELGEASATKRPTSVVMVARERNKKGKEVKEGDVAEFEEAYRELVRVVGKASKTVRK